MAVELDDLVPGHRYRVSETGEVFTYLGAVTSGLLSPCRRIRWAGATEDTFRRDRGFTEWTMIDASTPTRLAFDYELHGPIFREAGVQPGSEIHEHDENLSLVDILGIVYSFYGGDDSDDWAQTENIRRVLPVLSAPGRVENDHGNGWRAVIVSREVAQ